MWRCERQTWSQPASREIAGAEVFAPLRAPPLRSAAALGPERGTPVWGWGVLHWRWGAGVSGGGGGGEPPAHVKADGAHTVGAPGEGRLVTRHPGSGPLHDLQASSGTGPTHPTSRSQAAQKLPPPSWPPSGPPRGGSAGVDWTEVERVL